MGKRTTIKKLRSRWRIRNLWLFKTFLLNVPRVGALQFVKRDPEDLIRLYLTGNLSADLEEQFLTWMKDHNERPQ